MYSERKKERNKTTELFVWVCACKLLSKGGKAQSCSSVYKREMYIRETLKASCV